MDNTFDDKWGKVDDLLCARVEEKKGTQGGASLVPVASCVAVAFVLFLCEPPIVRARKNGLSSPRACPVRILLISLSIGAIGVGLERFTRAANF